MRNLRLGSLILAAAAAIFSPGEPAERAYAFPRDHGAHPDLSLEWWYWTGHLRAGSGADYGFQLTFFRLKDIHLAHFAWSDVSRQRFTFEEKTHLALPGIAGAKSERLDVSNEDWSAREDNGVQKLRARTREGLLTLSLKPVKPPVLHGGKGISRKGPGPDEYSNYVSVTRLSAAGTLERDGKTESLTGTAWFDHEWGPGGLPSGVAGWDWFALQLDDGSDVMLYRMRKTDGSASSFSAGTYVPAAGAPRPILWTDVRLTPKSKWVSPASKAEYPAAWDLAIASLGLEVAITPLVPDQELRTAASTQVTYWEGACAVTGRQRGRPIGGRAYVEMTGYAGPDVPGLGKP